MPNNAGRLTWDGAGQKIYELGVDRGVLYRPTAGVYSLGVAWMGLVNVTESPSGADNNKFYADNIEYGAIRGAEEFGGSIECYTYPDEFKECNGEMTIVAGVTGNLQTRKPFGLSYRTKIGNDTDGIDYGYKIHLVYGATVSPSEKAHQTINDSPEAETMSFDFETTPVNTGFSDRPLSHITIDSTKVDSEKLKTFEDIIYGKDADETAQTDAVAPSLPLPDAVKAHFL
jgi:hypothetical protein